MSTVTSGSASERRTFVARFRMSPSVPSGPCSRTSTTVWWKFVSFSMGLATKSTPFATDDGENSAPARAGTVSRTVKSPVSRTPAMTFRAPVRPRKSDIRLFSRLLEKFGDRLRPAAVHVNSAKR